MASAMIERAELPVHKNKTFNFLSAMGAPGARGFHHTDVTVQ
jgi:hypothetical protein